MKQDDELWLKKMRERFQDYAEPAPPGGWDKLNETLSPPVQRKLIAVKWWGAAAAILLLAVSGVSFYFLHTPVADEIRLVKVSVVKPRPDVMPEALRPEMASKRTEPAKEISIKSYLAKTTTSKVVKDVEMGENIIPDQQDEQIEAVDSHEPVNNKVEDDYTANIDKPDPVKEIKDSGRGKRKTFYDPIVNKPSSRNSWTVGLSVNSGTASLLDNEGDMVQVRSSSSLALESLSDLTSNATGFIDLKDKEIFFNNGVPEIAESMRIEHNLPITVGLSIRKNLGNKFSVETGLTYTFLKSNIFERRQQGEHRGEQKLHYVGIPIKANWNFINSSNFTVYLTAGGMVEKCVYGKTLDKENTVKPLQLSLLGGVGAQYNISKQFGLYVEPGVSYFFDDGSNVETIRKETPFNFNLQAGVRFTY